MEIDLGTVQCNCWGSELHFMRGFTGGRHIDLTLNFLQNRVKTEFRQTYSEDWNQLVAQVTGVSRRPACSLSACV